MSEPFDDSNAAPSPIGDYASALASLPNDELLAALDLALLELEKRLLRYAQSGHEVREMGDEGLVLSVRAAARLAQGQSSGGGTAGRPHSVGGGDWQPTSPQPDWNDDPRAASEGDERS